MPWVRIDDEFASHPKVLEAGPLGLAMQVAGLCYCNRLRTNGRISRPAAASLLSFEGLGMHMWQGELVGGGEDAEWEMVVQDLVDVEMWHTPGHDCPDCPDIAAGFYIHDYLDYQPSKEQIEADREAKRDAGRKGGQASAQARATAAAQASAQAQGQAESKPNPKPNPSSSSSRVASEEPASSKPSDEDERVQQVWQEIARRKLTAATNVKNAATWKRKVMENDRAELGTEAVRLVAQYPSISVSQLAACLMGERQILRMLPRSIAEAS